MIMGKPTKVVICGTKRCGKTSIVEQAIYGHFGVSFSFPPFLRENATKPMIFLQPFHETTEDVYEANIDTERGTTESVRFYDTEGIDARLSVQDQLPKHLLSIADGVVIVYSIEDEKSFQVAEAIRKEVDNHKDKKDFVIVVLGNKSELPPTKRKVDNVQALNWAAREKVKLFEVSALDRASLFEPLIYLSSKLHPPSNKSTFSQLTIGRNKGTKD